MEHSEYIYLYKVWFI